MKPILFGIVLTLCMVNPSRSNDLHASSRESQISFRIGNMRVNTVNGTFTGMKGTVSFDPQNLAASVFSVCIDASTVNTGISRRDKHLKEEEYFHVERYPDICFVSESITRSATGFTARGKLTIKGVTRTVAIPFVMEGNTLRGTININRLDYNVGEGVGTFLVSDPVEVEIIYVL